MKKAKALLSLVLVLLLLAAIPASAAPTRSQMDAHASFLLGGRTVRLGSTIYYLQRNGIYQMTLEGTAKKRVYSVTDPQKLQVYGDTLYFMVDGNDDGLSDVYSLKPGDKTAKKAGIAEVSPDGYYIAGDVLYYADQDDALRSLHLKNGEKRLIKKGYMEMSGFWFEGAWNGKLYIGSSDGDVEEGGYDGAYIDIYDYASKKLLDRVFFKGVSFSAYGENIYVRRDKGLYQMTANKTTGKLSGAKLVQAFTMEQYVEYFLAGKDMYFINYTEDGATLYKRAIASGKPKQVYHLQTEKGVDFSPCGDYIWVFVNDILQDKIKK